MWCWMAKHWKFMTFYAVFFNQAFDEDMISWCRLPWLVASTFLNKIWIWLVALTLLKNMKVNGKDDIPYVMENKKCLKPPTRNDLPGFFYSPNRWSHSWKSPTSCWRSWESFSYGTIVGSGTRSSFGTQHLVGSLGWRQNFGIFHIVLAQRKHQQMHLAVVLEISSEAVDAHLNKRHKKPRELHRSWQHPLGTPESCDQSRSIPTFTTQLPFENIHIYIYYTYTFFYPIKL